jgi:RNA polymerase sigma-70 factor, ECF subfamily
MDANEWQTEQFERNRTHLRAVAYRILGSVAEADDAVQEAWLRLNRSDTSAVENMRGWLTTVVSRVALDMLRARRSRREEVLEGPLAEPVITIPDPADPEQQALMADSVGLALLVVLETLTPAERLAFVLHDMFGMPFEEIAPVVERTPGATRQLASRARRRVRGAAPDPYAHTLAEQRRVVDAFLAAAQGGDFDRLVAVLDPDVEFHADRGALAAAGAAPAEVTGAEEAARLILARGAPFARFARPAVVNGKAGLAVVRGGRLISVLEFTVAGDRVAAIDLVADPRKLERVRI